MADFIINKLFSYCLDWTESYGYVYVPFFFFFFHFMRFTKRQETINTVLFIYYSSIFYVLFMELITILLKIYVKNRPHDTIYTFKNYFIKIFSVFATINSIQTYA